MCNLVAALIEDDSPSAFQSNSSECRAPGSQDLLLSGWRFLAADPLTGSLRGQMSLRLRSPVQGPHGGMGFRGDSLSPGKSPRRLPKNLFHSEFLSPLAVKI